MRLRAFAINSFLLIILGICFVTPSTALEVTEGNRSQQVAEPDYILGPEDILEISVWKEPDLSKTVAVRPDGKISLPLIGDLQAEGLTAEGMKENIKKALTDFVEDATVAVTVVQINSLKIFMQGEVNRPGVYDLKSNFTIIQAISLAGGFTQWAKKDKITIFRKERGSVVSIPINYKKIISGEDSAQNVILKRGDTIVVP